MTVRNIPARRQRFARSLVQTALLAVALLTGAATQAFAAGSISGRVTSSTTSSGLQGTVIQFYDLIQKDGTSIAPVTTDSSGNYTANLPASTYAVITKDIHGHINEIYNNLPCSAVCDTNGIVGVVVTNSAITGIDFVLDPGGRITGKVTQADGTTPIAGVRVNFVDPVGRLIFTNAVSDALGNYISDGGTVTGSVYAFTTNTQGYQDEIYDNIHCPSCRAMGITTGTAIAVTLAGGASGINFSLDLGGRITGTVRDGAGNPLANVGVNIYDSTGNLSDERFLTDGSGNYSTAGFPAGNYFAATRNFFGLVDQLYNNLPCYGGQCNPTVGTPIPVTIGGTASGRDFVLVPGGTITGTITNSVGGAPLENVFVGIFTAAAGGTFVGGTNTNSVGVYSLVLPAGTYFAAVIDQAGFGNQIYNGLPCLNNSCNVTSGTPINVSTGATSGNINFSLSARGTITGTVTNAAGGAALSGISVQILTTAGVLVGNANTNGSGVYTAEGLAVGSYYVRTAGVGSAFIHQLYNGVVCIGCNVTTSGGTLVPVTSGGTATINFALTTGGRISGIISNAVGGALLQGVAAQLFTSTGVSMGNFTTDASGVYTTSGLPAGNYFVRTGVSATQNFIDEVYNDIPCVPCAVTIGSAVAVVGTAPTSGINFALSPGGSIAGTVTDAGTAAPVAIGLLVYDSTGVIVKNVTSDASGNYTASGLPTGNYFIRTNPNVSTQNYVTQLYNGISYGGLPTTGTPVNVTVGATHGGVNFALVSGGSLSGTVTASDTGAPLAQVQIAVYSPSGKVVKMLGTDASGNVTITGLAAGTYYVSTSAPSNVTPFYMDELYDNIPCVGCVTISGSALPIVTLPCAACPAVTTGTPIVIINGATRTGVDFVLAPGAGVISGAVTSAATGVGLVNVQVSVYNGAGALVKSVTTAQNTGGYLVRGLAPGTYYLRTIVSPATPYYTDQAYGGAACAPCDVTTTSAAVLVSANATSTVNFPLASGGAISGVVTDAGTTNPLSPVDVQLYNTAGTLVKTTFTGSTGGFTLDGLPAGNYYARTAVPASLSIYVDELYDNIPCVSCTVTTGTAIVVTNGTTRSGVNFGLLPAAPVVVTSAATGITQTGATLNGTVNPKGSPTTALFQYGLTTSYGSQVTATPAPGSGTSPVAVSAAIAGLSCGTPYHFRVQATNTGGTTNGGDLTVTSGACPPVITQVSPSSGQQGQANLNVVITGSFTHFAQGTTSANLGAGITVNSTTVQSATQATANVTIALGATLGARTVTVTTGGEVVSLASGFTVTASAPTLTQASPSAGRRSAAASLVVTLTAQSTHFLPGTTTASFGAGITVNSVTVLSPALATVNITIPAGAALGARTVTVTTVSEVVTLAGGFVVTPLSVTRGDFDADSRADVAVFRPSTGAWYVRGVSTTIWGGGADIPVAGDYDGDGKADVAVYRPSTGVWFILLSGSATGSVTTWGGGGDIPVPGDYDGDGRTDVAVFRPSTGAWYVLNSGTATGSVTTWGGGADIPAARDYDGDGKTDVAVFRPSSGVWYILQSSTATGSVATWGGGADIPVSADYDGDGKADIAVFRPSTGVWYILRSSTATGSVTAWGGGADIPVPGDYDADGKTDIAVFRPSSGDWFIINSSTGTGAIVTWGGGADIPILKRP